MLNQSQKTIDKFRNTMQRTRSDMNFNPNQDIEFQSENEIKNGLYKELSKNLLNNNIKGAKKVMDTVNNLKVNSIVNHI